MEDFLSSYIDYASNTEVPAVFNRWSAIASVGALLGRRYYLEHGHFMIYPNMYCMLIGTPGTRKSTAIKLVKKLITAAGYETIGADKTTKEKFLMDLAGVETDSPSFTSVDNFLDQNLFGTDSTPPDSEMFVMADEFNEFFGNGNIEFISLLGNLWDYSGVFKNRIKNGKSLEIYNPTVSILGGNTPTNLSLAFPPEVFGQGFFSRMLFIYGEPNGKQIAFPDPPDDGKHRYLLETIKKLRQISGPAKLPNTSKRLLEKIYSLRNTSTDVRFESYGTRRFSHLLKLCLITSASRCATSISERDIIYANTILSHAESYMPKALGEFGKAKHSDISHKVMQIIDGGEVPVSFRDIWKQVSNDLEKVSDLASILQNLREADKIQVIDGGLFLPKKRVLEYGHSDLVDYSLLTTEELGMKR